MRLEIHPFLSQSVKHLLGVTSMCLFLYLVFDDSWVFDTHNSCMVTHRDAFNSPNAKRTLVYQTEVCNESEKHIELLMTNQPEDPSGIVVYRHTMELAGKDDKFTYPEVTATWSDDTHAEVTIAPGAALIEHEFHLISSRFKVWSPWEIQHDS
ncbi:hypothetical protein [Aliagarivorans taiwanensis]|uniref:hypothetical protein n=1 Tax=Aliagarivorans taiwanensis TaxID=561966 RepID=UPI00041788B9|nr:hypothetical protein [Aliagarivorans taiwanensis]